MSASISRARFHSRAKAPFPYLSQVALELLEKNLPPGARVVITGSTGWLGHTLAAMLQELSVPTLLLASSSRTARIGDLHRDVHAYEDEVLARFSPTVLVDFAFVTREHLSDQTLEEFTAVNNGLIHDAVRIASRTEIRHIIFCSSGAAVHPQNAYLGSLEDNPYGYLKMLTEHTADALALEYPDKKVLVLRPWSLSGAFVTKIDSFAFSSFALQALSGQISVRSTFPIRRRYVSADDFLAVALACLFSNKWNFRTLDSGGDLITAVELAQLTAKRVAPEAHVSFEVDMNQQSDDYFSDNSSWSSACSLMNFQPESLVEQVDRLLLALEDRAT